MRRQTDNNRLSSETTGGVTTTYGYDNNGNTTSKAVPGTGTTTYSYDYENRMTGISYPGGGSASFVYDGDGLRIRKTEAGVTRNFLFDGVRIYGEYDGSMMEQARYMWDGKSYYSPLIAAKVGASWYYPLLDSIGSVRRLLDSNQTAVSSYSYEAFGDILSQTGSVHTPFKYIGSLGYYQDSTTGLLHVGARYFNTGYGRFATHDPLPGDLSDLNPYTYVRNEPARLVDPSGELHPAVIAALLAGGYLAACGGVGVLDATLEGVVTSQGRPWPQRDKFAHCTAACVIRRCGTVVESWALGLLKELWDARFGLRRSGWDRQDLAANHEGEKCAKAVKSVAKCGDCCKQVYPPPCP